jgi:hypothetical protein
MPRAGRLPARLALSLAAVAIGKGRHAEAFVCDRQRRVQPRVVGHAALGGLQIGQGFFISP